MKIKSKSFLFIFSFFFFGSIGICCAQTNLDSLWKVWNDAAQRDTNRLNALDKIIWDGFLYTNTDSALSLAKIEGTFAEEKGLKKYQAKAINAEGVAFLIQGKYDDALQSFNSAKKFYEELNDKKGIATSLNNIGLVYNNKGELENAMDYYLESLKIREEISDKKGAATSIHTIGNIYHSQGDFGNALKNYIKSLKIKEEIGDKKGMANTLNNLGLLYKEIKETKKALEYHQRSLKIREEIKDSYGIAVSLNNIAEIYFFNSNYNTALDLSSRALKLQTIIGDKEGAGISFTLLGNIRREQGEYENALDNYLTSLKIREEIGDNAGIANAQNNIARNYFLQKEYKKAIEFGKKALETAEFVGLSTEIRDASNTLYLSYKALDKNSDALLMHELYLKMKDSTESAQVKRELATQESKLNYEKQAFADSLAFAKQKEMRELEYNAQIERERNRQYVLYGSLIFLLLLGALGYKSYLVKKKDNELLSKQKLEITEKNERLELANTEINNQKTEIEHKNKDIVDSINYAKRLQTAILPSDEDFKKILPDAFVFYNPKDIVSGDFYFLDKAGDNIFFAVADCTGHGVPGAFVSFVGHKALDHAISDLGLTDPGKILDTVRTEVEHTFDKNEKGEVKDGMDISLGVLNTKTDVLHFAGAHHTLYRVTKNEEVALVEIKGNRQAVGAGQGKEPFTTQSLTLNKGDMIYFSSDGYSDQFGGPEGKKFKTSQFKKLLLEIYDKPVATQKELFANAHNSWKGAHEQVDDVCVMGVKIV